MTAVQLCYICGAADGNTRDHVFPRGLFPPGTLPSHPEPPIAPACSARQQNIQPDEEYFRTLAASGAYADEAGRALWDGKIKRSFDNSPGFRQSFANAIRTTEWKSPGGIILGEVTGIEGDQQRIGNVLRKMVRGLFWIDSGGTVMPFDVRFNYSQVSPMTPPLPGEVMDLFHSMPLRSVGEIVKFKFGYAPDEPRAIVTWMAFYGRTMFAVWTWPRTLTSPRYRSGSRRLWIRSDPCRACPAGVMRHGRASVVANGRDRSPRPSACEPDAHRVPAVSTPPQYLTPSAGGLKHSSQRGGSEPPSESSMRGPCADGC